MAVKDFDEKNSTQININKEKQLNSAEPLTMAQIEKLIEKKLSKPTRGEAAVQGYFRTEQFLKEFNTQLDNIQGKLAAGFDDEGKSEEARKNIEDLKEAIEGLNEKQEKCIEDLSEYYAISKEEAKEALERAKYRNSIEEEYEKILDRINLEREKINQDYASGKINKINREILLNDLDDQEAAAKVAKKKNLGKTSDIGILSIIDPLSKMFEKASDSISGPIGKVLYDISESLSDTYDRALIDNEKEHGILESIRDLVKDLNSSMAKSIDSAAASIKGYYGRISSNLESLNTNGTVYSGKTRYDEIAKDAENALGINRLVRQTDYLSQIAKLSDQGLVEDIEQRALLESIKDKTLTSFNVANAGLTRLVRLGEQSSINQFGVELQLKRLLNSKIFGDSSYLSNMFDSVTSAITEASIGTKSDITNFNSTVQTWLGAMYSEGLSDKVVSSIASGINALGSGNVNALAQDESTQRLFLLAMDRANMDYADILQQGLSSEETSNLLASIIELLNEIAGNTKDNLVLKSSYSNLFNLDISDMQAIQNINSKISSITNSMIDTQGSIDLTVDAVENKLSEYTSISEKWDNFFDNLSYTFGSNVAESNAMYSIYRGSEILVDILDSFKDTPGAVGKIAGRAQNIASYVPLALGGVSFIKMLSNKDWQSFNNSHMLQLLGDVSSSNEILQSAIDQSKTTDSSNSFKSISYNSLVEDFSAAEDTWKNAEDNGDETLKILQDMHHTLMELKGENENSYAFAVSLQGMSDQVLRSFASIFADESTMEDTFNGNNSVLEKAMFDYFEDTTSNTSGGDSKKSDSTKKKTKK